MNPSDTKKRKEERFSENERRYGCTTKKLMHELITATDNGTMAGNLQPPEAESSMFYEFFIAKFQQKEIDSKQI